MNESGSKSDFLVDDYSFIPFGISSMLGYSFISCLLSDIQNMFTHSFPSFITVSYGAASVATQLLAFFRHSWLINTNWVTLSFVVSIASVILLVLCAKLEPVNATRWGVVCMFLIGATGSIKQLSFSAVGTAFSVNGLNYFFLGQGIAGLLSLIVIRIGKCFLHNIFALSVSVVVLSGVVCVSIIPLFLNTVTAPLSMIKHDDQVELRALLHVGKVIKKEALSVLFIATVSFSIYPRYLLFLTPEQGSWFASAESYRGFLIYVAIVFDLIGMSVPIIWRGIPLNSIPLLTAFRILFIPIFWVVEWPSFSGDHLQIFSVVCMSFSGGLLFASILDKAGILAPQQSLVGFIISLSFALGVSMGAMLGYVLDRWVEIW